jgi:S1-C subfamily serine protease
VLLLQVFPNSRADQAGLEPGDVVLLADGATTNTPFQLSNVIQTDRANGQSVVNLSVLDVRTGTPEVVPVSLQ